MNKIDFVVPYVNNIDPIWQKSFVDFCMKRDYKHIASLHGCRYEDNIGLIYYQLKLINKNMPWINKIYLLLSNKEQVIPSLLPSNCEIVLHEQFIPSKYLPTFNSTTIEMFLWKIPNLSEKFIYANDDMLPMKPLKASDFFYGEHIRLNYKSLEKHDDMTMYRNQCYNSYHSLADVLHYQEDNTFYYPEHTFTPMIKSHCIECFELIKHKILPNIYAFRRDNQHNQYIYPNLERLLYGVYPSKIKFYYSHLNEENVREMITESDIFCANEIRNKENGKFLMNYLEWLCN